ANGSASGGATANWTKTLSAGSLVNGSSYLLSEKTVDTATNANTNTAAATSSFVYDTTAPAGAVSFPVDGTHYNAGGWSSSLAGSSFDATGSSGTTVTISIQKDGGANACWDGTDAAGHFTAACPNYVAV